MTEAGTLETLVGRCVARCNSEIGNLLAILLAVQDEPGCLSCDAIMAVADTPGRMHREGRMSPAPVRVVGYGNLGRGDDALGPELVARLEPLPEAYVLEIAGACFDAGAALSTAARDRLDVAVGLADDLLTGYRAAA